MNAAGGAEIVKTPGGEVVAHVDGFVIRPPQPSRKVSLDVYGKHKGQKQPGGRLLLGE
jgi:hypothetical protein